jgi:hypothetical protein
MPSPRSEVWRFAARTLAWLPPVFLAWYLAAPWYDRVPTWLAQGILGLYRGGLVAGVEQDGRMLTFVTSIAAPGTGPQVGVLTVDVNPLLSTYGTALFLGLMLASGGSARRIVAGLAAMLPFQAWGIAFDFIAALIRSGLAEPAGLAGWRAEFGALAYQLGSIIFPTLVPVVAWAVLQRRFIERLARPSPG